MTIDAADPALSSKDQDHLNAFAKLTDLIRDRTRSVAERYQVGCYLVGRAGTGKTYTVSETLDSLGKLWILRNSRMSPMGLWTLLEEHPEHTVVLDDISTLFNEVSALQILMAALGGKPGQPRTITYTTKDKHERKSFEFHGGIVAISNVALRRDPLADAVASSRPGDDPGSSTKTPACPPTLSASAGTRASTRSCSNWRQCATASPRSFGARSNSGKTSAAR